VTVQPASATTSGELVVALTFDFDAESPWLGDTKPGSPSAISRGTYGATEGVPRILALLDRLGLPATFYIPGDTADRHPDVSRTIVDAGHEIGHHGYQHEAPYGLSLDQERAVLERGLEALARLTSEPIRGYRAPSWELSANTASLLAANGFDYDASELGADRPYWLHDHGTPTDVVEIPGAWELCDASLFLFSYQPYTTGLAAPSRAEEIWLGDFDGMYEEATNACYVLTLHPQIIGRPHRMRLLERVIRHMVERDGVRFAHMADVAADFRTAQKLRHEQPSDQPLQG
jgi:peptidoglycan/xylan/chitin deacetylase (PgdA/CDA1 family)